MLVPWPYKIFIKKIMHYDGLSLKRVHAEFQNIYKGIQVCFFFSFGVVCLTKTSILHIVNRKKISVYDHSMINLIFFLFSPLL